MFRPSAWRFPRPRGDGPRDCAGFLVYLRFPRPRGDGPLAGCVAVRLHRVSPPTRGWTMPHKRTCVMKMGFPAHAGMDLPHVVSVIGIARFPRPRGDGPLPIEITGFDIQVSPPTRGWTLYRSNRKRICVGFPAHAGMDPMKTGAPYPSWGFPRPRGDGPVATALEKAVNAVSPPTRGWTVSAEGAGRCRAGFPAHAGMDPLPTGSPPERQRFPRPRGDGPPFCKAKLDERAVSPPTRGWTHDRGTDRLREGGFPAHAGMDLRCEMPSARVSWFPRPRGDGPVTAGSAAGFGWVSPPTRGWTRFPPSRSTRPIGFPAHAGMDPSAET